MMFEGAEVVLFEKAAHLKLHLFHVVIITVPASAINHMSRSLYSQFRGAVVVFVNGLAVVKGKPQPSETIKNIRASQEIERCCNRIETSEHVNGCVEPRLGQRFTQKRN